MYFENVEKNVVKKHLNEEGKTKKKQFFVIEKNVLFIIIFN